jgi:hypothetical protein
VAIAHDAGEPEHDAARVPARPLHPIEGDLDYLLKRVGT